MAGDTKTTDQREEVAAPDYANPFPSIQATLDDILETLRGRVADGLGIFDLPATTAPPLAIFGQHMWQRIQVQTIVVNCSAAGTFILTIGSYTRTWNVDIGVTAIPFPYTFDRAADISVAGTATGINGYIVAAAE